MVDETLQPTQTTTESPPQTVTYDFQNTAPVSLSKSWSVLKTHLPTFTGGKIVQACKSPLLLLPVGGNVAIVDAHQGVQHCTIRNNDVTDDDNDDNDAYDLQDITAFALAPNDTTIITCNRGSLIQQHVLEKVENQNSYKVSLVKSWGKSGHYLPVTICEFHVSSTFCATGSVDGTVRVWDVRGGFCTHVFKPLVVGTTATTDQDYGGSGTRAVTCVAWKKAVGDLIVAIGRDDGSITIHDLKNSNETAVCVLRDHVSAVTCIEWNTSGNMLVSGGRDAVLTLWQQHTIDNKNNETPNSSSNKTVKRKKDSKKLKKGQTLSSTSNVHYKRIHTLPVYEQIEGMTMLPTAVGDKSQIRIATAGSSGIVKLWKVTQGQDRMMLQSLAEQPGDQAFGEARGGYMRMLYQSYDSDNNSSQVEDATDEIDGVEGESKGCLIVADAEHNLSFLSVDQSNLLNNLRTIVGHNDDILDVKIIPNKNTGSIKKVAVVTNSAQIRIFDTDTFACRVLEKHTATVLCVDVSPCSRYLTTCGKDKTVRVWRIDDGTNVAIGRGHTEAVGATCFSRKAAKFDVSGKAALNGGGAFVVSVSVDKTLKRWNLPGSDKLNESSLTNGNELTLTAAISTRAHEKDINAVSIAPNDSLIATGSQDKCVKIWKSTDLTLLATLKGHKRGVWDCQFSSFDRVLASGSGDQTIKLWSLSDFSCVRTFQGHLASVMRIRFVSSGLQLMSSGGDGLVKLWTIRTNECEATMDGHFDKVWALDVASQGKYMVSGGADSRLVIWTDTTQEEDLTKQAEEQNAIVMDQKLANHLRHKEYSEALDIALTRDKPLNALRVFTLIADDSLKKGTSNIETLQKYVAKWDNERLAQVLRYCRDWNTRSKTCHVALTIVKSIVTSIPIPRLISIPNAAEIMAGIVPYAERHFDRVDKLYTNAYLLDFILTAMGGIDDVDDDDGTDALFESWQLTSKNLISQKIDGRIQIGGATLVGSHKDRLDDSDESMISIGDSDSSDSDSVVSS